MNSRYSICPKCGFSSEGNPDLGEICPACGVVFRKYELHAMHERSALTQTLAGTERGNESSQSLKGKIFGLTDMSRLKLLIAITALLMTFFSVRLVNYFSAEAREKRELLARWQEYSRLASFRSEDSYKYLAPTSAKRITSEKWNERISKNDPRFFDEASQVTVIKENTAVISINTLDENNVVINKYPQTWVKVNGVWFRAWYEDNPEADIIDNEVPKEKALPIKEQLLKLEARTTWGVEKDPLGSKIFYKPRTTVTFTSAHQDINSLQILVRYLDKKNGSVFGEDTEYVVGESDIPIKSGEQRDVYFSSPVGYTIANMRSVDADAYKTLARQIEVKVFARRSSDENWSEIVLR